MRTGNILPRKTKAGLWVGIVVGAAIARSVSLNYNRQTRYTIKTYVTQLKSSTTTSEK